MVVVTFMHKIIFAVVPVPRPTRGVDAMVTVTVTVTVTVGMTVRVDS